MRPALPGPDQVAGRVRLPRLRRLRVLGLADRRLRCRQREHARRPRRPGRRASVVGAVGL